MDVLDFGRYLSNQRELRGLSRADVVAVTKISESTIAALEGGKMERLPSRMYVLKFIAAYAEAIGLEPEETVLRYEEVDPSDATLAFHAEPPPPTPIDGRSAPSDPANAPPPQPLPETEETAPAAKPPHDGPVQVVPVAKRPPSWSRVSELSPATAPRAGAQAGGSRAWLWAAGVGAIAALAGGAFLLARL